MSTENDKLEEAVPETEKGNLSPEEAGNLSPEEAGQEVVSEEKLEEKVAEGLQKLYGDSEETPKKDEDTEETDEETDDESAEDETESEETTPEKPAEKTEDDNSTPEDSDDKQGEESSGDEEVPPLPDAYYRAAIHQGWSKDDIDGLYKNSPELATKTFANIYESVNRATKDFSAIGRARQAAANAATETAKTAGAEKQSEFKAIDIEALKRDSEGDPLVGVLAEIQNQNKALFDKVQELSQAKPDNTAAGDIALERANAKEMATMEKELDLFFKDPDYAPYKDFYGTVGKESDSWEGLTPGEKANRWAVIKEAEMIMVGAEESNLDMQLTDALRRAHLIVSEPLKEKILRQDVVKHLKKRQKGITLRPSGKATDSTGVDAKKDDSALIVATKERLNNMFNN